MWVEADCNIIDGESMVRQILHGKNFFRDEFGVDIRNLWLPDVFGYSAAMPQILKRSGVDYFLTQKLSWSQFNTFPHTTFLWQGIDGSQVITHFPPENSYNSKLTPQGLRKAEENFREKDVLDEMLCLFGVGDGGGGPRDDLVELGKRQANLEGLPKVRFGRADDFFQRLSRHQGQLPRWRGELYLELHRGTLTTQARTKRGNRQLERALRETEYLWSCLPLSRYPASELDQQWKTLLRNQFHDIIPGSSIHRVYEETEQDYADGLAVCDRLRTQAGEAFGEKNTNALTAVNTRNRPVHAAVVLPETFGEGLNSADGLAVAVQKESDGTVCALLDLPPQGMVTLTKNGQPPAGVTAVDLTLENGRILYTFAPNGEIVRAYDKEAQRDILPEGQRGNVLTLYQDRPNNWDAWDIDAFYEAQALETAQTASHQSLGRGPVRQGISFDLRIGNSEVRQRIYLEADSKYLQYETEVEWRERHRMLRTAFPLALAADRAVFDIQYGYVERNTHRNLSWDAAKFEVAAQTYADLSSQTYGAALLNDCKYGYKVHDNVLDMNLLRSPTFPDADADQGHHTFTYGFLPHQGPLIGSSVIDRAKHLNRPPVLLPMIKPHNPAPPVQITGNGVFLESLKKAEKSDTHVIRVAERFGAETTARLIPSDPDTRIVETDLMEWRELREWDTADHIPLRPFDIRTFQLIRKSNEG